MDETVRNKILAMSRTAHGWTESSYQQNPAKRGDSGWADKQRVLLADMALHLLQTSLKEGPISEDELKRNLFSILTISDQFIPDHDLGTFADGLFGNPPSGKASHP